jgi:hypothetical protein
MVLSPLKNRGGHCFEGFVLGDDPAVEENPA